MPLHMCDAIIEESEYGKNTVYTLKDATLLKQEGRISAASLPLVKSGGFAAKMRHFCGSFATRQIQLCGIFQRIHRVFATF